MDFSGLGAGLLDKIEEHWGKRVSRVLSFLISLALAAGCIALIWTWMALPALTFFQTPLWGRSLTQLLLTAVAIGGGIAVGLFMFSALGQWQKYRQSKRRLDAMEKKFDALFHKAAAMGAKTDQTVEHSSVLLEGILIVLREKITEIPAGQQEVYRTHLAEAEKHLASVKEERGE